MSYEDRQEAYKENYDALYDTLSVRKPDITTWSPSSTKVFLGCRLKYFFQYVEGWRIKARSPALSLGTAFHSAAEKFNRSIALGQDWSIHDLFEAFDTSWETEVGEMRPGIDYKDEGEIAKNRQIGLDLIDKHVKSTIRKAYSPAIYQPPFSSVFTPAVELNVNVPFVNIQTGRVNTDKHRITGFVDLVSVADKATSHFEPGDLMVLDYKTASKEWDQFSVDTNLQLLMYAYAIRYILRNENWFPHLRKSKEDIVGIICLIKQRAGKQAKQYGKIKYYMIRITDDEIKFLENLLQRCIQDLEGSGNDVKNFLPNPTPDNCKYCEYKDPCLMVRRGANTKEIIDWGKTMGLTRKGKG